MKNFLDGKKTWIGLLITILGFFGVGEMFGNENISKLLDLIFQTIGIAYAMYGNYKAHEKIAVLENK